MTLTPFIKTFLGYIIFAFFMQTFLFNPYFLLPAVFFLLVLFPFYRGQVLLALAGFLSFIFYLPGIIALALANSYCALSSIPAILSMFACALWLHFKVDIHFLEWLDPFLPGPRDNFHRHLFLYALPGVIALFGTLFSIVPLLFFGTLLALNFRKKPVLVEILPFRSNASTHQLGWLFYLLPDDLLENMKHFWRIISPHTFATAETQESNSRLDPQPKGETPSTPRRTPALPPIVIFQGGPHPSHVQGPFAPVLTQLNDTFTVTIKLNDETLNCSTVQEGTSVDMEVDGTQQVRVKKCHSPKPAVRNSANTNAIQQKETRVTTQLQHVVTVLAPLLRQLNTQLHIPLGTSEEKMAATFTLKPNGDNELSCKTPTTREYKARVSLSGNLEPITEGPPDSHRKLEL